MFAMVREEDKFIGSVTTIMLCGLEGLGFVAMVMMVLF